MNEVISEMQTVTFLRTMDRRKCSIKQRLMIKVRFQLPIVLKNTTLTLMILWVTWISKKIHQDKELAEMRKRRKEVTNKAREDQAVKDRCYLTFYRPTKDTLLIRKAVE